MDNLIIKIEELRQKLNGLKPIKPEFQEKLNKKFRLEFNFNSNHLEGNTLTYNETELLLIFDETKGNHTLREYEEMKAHDVALQLIQEWASDIERPLTETNIKDLNEIILVKPFWKDAITKDGQKTKRLIKVGDYKEYPNSVQLSNGEIFDYASVTDTPILMGELINWYQDETNKNELHPVALAALLHYKFVCIHPFDDGNGRLSRLLMNYVLYKNNLPPIIIKSRDKRNYLSALNDADSGEMNSFIKYIAQQLIWSLDIYIKAANGESIEEPEDIDKEIEVWKKQATLNFKEAKLRNDELIYELYINVIKVLFEQFIFKHKQFNDMFYKVTSNSFLNSGSNSRTNWLDDEIDRVILKSREIFYKEGADPQKTRTADIIQSIHLMVSFQDYKYDDKNRISINSTLRFDFEPYKYEVKFGNKIIEKRYGEFLDFEEQNEIITESIKTVFNEIKQKLNKGKK